MRSIMYGYLGILTSYIHFYIRYNINMGIGILPVYKTSIKNININLSNRPEMASKLVVIAIYVDIFFLLLLFITYIIYYERKKWY